MGDKNVAKYMHTLPETRDAKIGTMPLNNDPKYKRYNYVRTNEAVKFAEQNGHDATIFHNIDDGGHVADFDRDIVDEIVYAPGADVIKAPLTESRTATTFRIGDKYHFPNTSPITAADIYRNNTKETTAKLRKLGEMFRKPYLLNSPIRYNYK